MSTKQLAVRLIAEGGQQLRAELQGVGRDGSRGMRTIEDRTAAANRSLARFARRARMAFAAATVGAAAAGAAMVRSGLQTIDAQSKMAQSLRTTVESVQVLQRAADLAGISTGDLNSAMERLTRRLSQAAAGGGPAAAALDRLQLSARELQELPLDDRLRLIRERMAEFVPEAERAAVMSQLFGRQAGVMMGRLDDASLAQAAADVRDFGVAVSDVDAAQIERTNDAISRLGLITRGLANQLAVAAAPALEALADAMASVARTTGPLGRAISGLFDQLGRILAIAGTFAAFLVGRWVFAMGRAALSVLVLTTNLTRLRAALVRTGFGALIVAAGEVVYQFGRLVSATGDWGEALTLLRDVAAGVWDGIVASAQSVPLRLTAVWARIRAGFLSMLAGMVESWDGFLGKLSALANIPGIDPITSGLRGLGVAAQGAQAGIESMREEADRASRVADALTAGARNMTTQGFEPAREAMERLRAVINESADDGEGAADRIREGMVEVEAAMDSAAGGAGRAGAAGVQAADEVATAWDNVSDSLARYAESAMNTGAQIGDAITGAMRSAEDAFVRFVTTGKADFSSLVNSILADLARLMARQFITGPIASALAGVFGGVGAPLNAMGSGTLASFAGGGHTGWGARSGGLDGMGGRLAMIHPQERIIDESRNARGRAGRGIGDPMIVDVTIMARDAESFRQSRTQIAADIARAVNLGRRGM